MPIPCTSGVCEFIKVSTLAQVLCFSQLYVMFLCSINSFLHTLPLRLHIFASGCHTHFTRIILIESLLVQYTYVQWKLPVHMHNHSPPSIYLFYLNGPIKSLLLCSAICSDRLTVNSMIKDTTFLGHDAMVSGK